MMASSSQNPTVLYRNEQLLFRNLIADGLAIAFMAISLSLVSNEYINLAGNVKGGDLEDFASKIEFTFKYQCLGAIWMIFSFWHVISKRMLSPAIDPLAGHEHLADAAKNILTNSLEQFVMCLISQYSLIAYLDGDTTQKIIPLLNILFLIGRFTFWAGYPNYRFFGLWVTMCPIQIAIWYSFSCFIEFTTGVSSILLTWGIPISFYIGWFSVTKHV